RGLADVAPHAQADALDAVLRDLRRRLGADSTRMPVALGVPITGDEVTTVYEAARWAERLAARDAAPAVRLAETLYERLGAGREAVTTDDGVLVWHRPDESVPVETETE
ncbi:hypothetical protein, partial [Nocardiopsis halophila]|uniref:hypothetical protein n=1 Tax=Nocardiopsis halophila TaxID=141692 RepID=UPI000584ED99